MKLLLFVIVNLCFANAHREERIYGGRDAFDGKYPFMVFLKINDIKPMCGGSIINNRWILTAAHCLVGYEHTPIAIFAGTNLIEGGTEQVYQSEYIIPHQKFSREHQLNDIGLIRVDKNIQFNDRVQPIELPKYEFYHTDYPVTLIGWGATMMNWHSSNNLQEIDLKIYDLASCREHMKFSANIWDTHICTMAEIGRGLCSHDSGGPLIANGVQIGIVSFGVPCGRGNPDVFTRVYSFLDWIAAEQAKFLLL